MKWYKYDIRDMCETEYDKWFSLMSEDKKHKVSRFHFDDDKKRSAIGEMLAKKAVEEFCGVSAEDIILRAGENGKPYAENADVNFNISHSGNLVVCAVHDKPVGIDVEQIRNIELKVAKRVYTHNELFYLFGFNPAEEDFCLVPDEKMLLRFFELWTAKEAYLKYTGEGILAELKTLEVNPEKILREYYEDYVISIYKD